MLYLCLIKKAIKIRVASLAADYKNIVITEHAKKRMKQRDITSFEVQNALKHGKIVFYGKGRYGKGRLGREHKLKIDEDVYGRRIRVVVTVSIKKSNLLVVTTYEV